MPSRKRPADFPEKADTSDSESEPDLEESEEESDEEDIAPDARRAAAAKIDPSQYIQVAAGKKNQQRAGSRKADNAVQGYVDKAVDVARKTSKAKFFDEIDHVLYNTAIKDLKDRGIPLAKNDEDKLDEINKNAEEMDMIRKCNGGLIMELNLL